jgi:hypothetical protein
MQRLVGHRPCFEPPRAGVDSRNQTETCQWTLGSAEVFQVAGAPVGRALRTHGVIDVLRGPSSALVDLAATSVTSAASSSGVGAPRTTVTSGSSFIDRAYGEP